MYVLSWPYAPCMSTPLALIHEHVLLTMNTFTLWTWHVKCEQVKCEGAQTIFCGSDYRGSNIHDLLKISYTSWVNSSSSSWCCMRERCWRSLWQNGNWSTLSVTWCQHSRRSDGIYTSVSLATLPSLGRHESYNFSAASVSRPSHAIHSAFFTGGRPPSVPANRPCRRAVIVPCCSRLNQRREIYLATTFLHFVAPLHKSLNWHVWFFLSW